MKFIKIKTDKVANTSYLLVNNLGGFSSSLINGELTRQEHGLFIASMLPPLKRVKLIDSLNETIEINNKVYHLNAQEYVCNTKNINEYVNVIDSFEFEYIATWNFLIDGVEITKRIAFEHLKNTLCVEYFVKNLNNEEAILNVVPGFSFNYLGENKKYDLKLINNVVIGNDIELKINTNDFNFSNYKMIDEDLYYRHDSVDGRNSVGLSQKIIKLDCQIKANDNLKLSVVFSLEDEYRENIVENEVVRRKNLIDHNASDLIQALTLASEQFIVQRTSTNAKTIIAGYPFFADWGRDTMIAMLGSVIATKRFDDCKEIFDTFIHYLDNGLIPNMFPEKSNDAAGFYNSVDAPLLLIWALYEYYKVSNDIDYIKDVGIYAINDIISNYKKGTIHNIHMEDDGLITAGSGLDQLTWMDVRFGKILPTPRQGKPVEISGMWYNALKVSEFFSNLLGIEFCDTELTNKVKLSFNNQFVTNNGLKDVLNGTYEENQIRPNQVLVCALPFSPVDNDVKKVVLDTVYKHLFTTNGLRSLSYKDIKFKAKYGGSHFNRDMAYHQGTVWPFLIGNYYLTYLDVYQQTGIDFVENKTNALYSILNEGCVGQISEIYDGLNPTISCGCFAQAWSVSEYLRVLLKVREMKR